MRLKIVSDGTPAGTQVVNQETGERVELIQEISWKIKVGGISECIITLLDIPIEVFTELKEKHLIQWCENYDSL